MFRIVREVVFHPPADGDEFAVRVVDDFGDLPAVAGQGFVELIPNLDFHKKDP